MAKLYSYLEEVEEKREYLDRSAFTTLEQQQEAKDKSLTVYVGNLSFYSSELQIYNLFTYAGSVDRVIMGLHRVEKTPCGFCFVSFRDRPSVIRAKHYLNGAVLDGKVITVDVDPGFREGRQFGRARSGGQVTDEIHRRFDPQRPKPIDNL